VEKDWANTECGRTDNDRRGKKKEGGEGRGGNGQDRKKKSGWRGRQGEIKQIWRQKGQKEEKRPYNKSLYSKKKKWKIAGTTKKGRKMGYLNQGRGVGSGWTGQRGGNYWNGRTRFPKKFYKKGGGGLCKEKGGEKKSGERAGGRSLWCLLKKRKLGNALP